MGDESMSRTKDARGGIAILCDETGQVINVVRDDLHLFHERELGIPFLSVVDEECAEKASRFLQGLHKDEALFNWELDFKCDKDTAVLEVSGTKVGDQLIIMVTRSKDDMYQYYNQVGFINNEQVNLVRRLSKEVNVRSKEHQRWEDQIYNDLMRLNNELANLQREMAKKNRELTTLNQQKNQFLGMAAHDLRNPLGIISKYSDFLLTEDVERLNAEQVKFISTIKSSSDFILGLVEDFLDVSKIESGKLEINREPTDIIALCKHNIALNSTIAVKKDSKITFQCNAAVPKLVVDKRKIEQVLNNLLTNAVKYSFPHTEITVDIKLDNNAVVIAVTDQGQGIPEHEIQHLFQPYRTTSVRATGGEKSTGLGLLIARRIVEGHDGRIWLESEVGKGSTFYVSLPMVVSFDEAGQSDANAKRTEPQQESKECK